MELDELSAREVKWKCNLVIEGGEGKGRGSVR